MHPDRRASGPERFQAYSEDWAEHCLRVLKPGGHIVAFGSPRTFHRLASGLEDAGFELRDTLSWLYSTGMVTARQLPDGAGSKLKPAWEPILLARKPPAGPIITNVQRHGTGALNVDACRHDNRYPANLLLGHDSACAEAGCADGCAVAAVDEETGRPVGRFFYSAKASRCERDAGCENLPAGPLERFQYAQGPNPRPVRNPHPTVKPIALMRWLVSLITPIDGLVLDPFCGSGSTGAAAALEHRRFLGIEAEAQYIPVAHARLSHWARLAEREGRDRDPFDDHQGSA
jgi:site-specific DNA-methyltransferase (adenine-specific)